MKAQTLNTQTPSLAMAIGLLTAAVLSAGTPLAQILTDGTVGPVVELSGPEMTVGAELGTIRGANLFHSFSRLDIPEGQRATFTGPEHIHNVIGRVTGGRVSRIDGTLRSQVGRADVYLINPAGIVLGPQAQVDVPAALHLSTAEELRFADGSRYSARDPQASTLTLAAPESFGFLSPQAASLEIKGSQLALTPGQTLSLTAGEIQVRGLSAEQPAALVVPQGEIRLEAVGGGERQVPVRGAGEAGTGRLVMEHAQVVSSGEGGGAIRVRAGEAKLRGSLILATNTGPHAAPAGIDLAMRDGLRLTGGSWISTGARGSGRAGGLALKAKELVIAERSSLTSIAYGAGDTGDLSIQADRLWLDGDSTELMTAALPESSGQLGDIRIQVSDLMRLTHGARIDSAAWGSRRIGDIQIQAGGLELTDGSQIATDILEGGWGGAIRIQADQLALAGPFTRIGNTAYPGAAGRPGELRIQVSGSMCLSDGASIESDNSGQGAAGGLSIDAGTIELTDGTIATLTQDSGAAASLELRTGELRMTGQSWISSDALPDATGPAGDLRLRVDGTAALGDRARIASNTWGVGPAGRIEMQAGSLALQDAAMLSTATYGAGDGGALRLEAGRLRITGSAQASSGIFAIANPGSSGDAGSLDIAVSGPLEISDGGRIEGGTYASGAGGQVRVSAGQLQIDGGDTAAQGIWTGISSGTGAGSTGAGGDLEVSVLGPIVIQAGGQIDSSTFGAGQGGSIWVKGDALLIDGQGVDLFTGISSGTSVQTTGDAGAIWVEIKDLIELVNGGQIDSSAYGVGDAGSIWIEAGSIRLDGANGSGWPTAITSSAHVGSTGNAGTIGLRVAEWVELAHGATIDSATHSSGHAGVIELQAMHIAIDGSGTDRFTGITTQAGRQASGQVGSIDLAAQSLSLRSGGAISIGAYQNRVDPTPGDLPPIQPILSINARSIRLDAGWIDAKSTSQTPASPIAIWAQDLRLVNGSRITTESLQADAGPISIGGGRLWVKDSQITTSALGDQGNGGDIVLRPESLILDGGFIQANTAALGARGGDIWVGSRVLLGSQGQVEIGGRERASVSAGAGRNVIQAAAPGGEQGVITVVAPELDLTAALVPLAVVFGGGDELLTDPCQAVAAGGGSSLVEGGSGGIPAPVAEPAVLPLDHKRLERLGL